MNESEAIHQDYESELSDNDSIQCYGFCGEPAEIRNYAQRLLLAVNAGESVGRFISDNANAYLSLRNIESPELVDITAHWANDSRETIVTLATTLALGCRRLMEQDPNDHYNKRQVTTVTVGKVLEKSSKGHDKYINGDDLDFIDACSRLIHAKEWHIRKACNISHTPGSSLKVQTDTDGEYEVCLSSFALCAWMLTKDFSYGVNGAGYISSAPNLISQSC